MKNRYIRYLIAAIFIYTLGVGIIVAIHLVRSNSFLLDVKTSISRYMGMKMWSAAAYIFIMPAVCFCLYKYLKCPELPRVYKMIGYAVIVSLLLIAIFPYGAFGSTVTDIHRVLSREVFLSMMIHTVSGIRYFSGTKYLLVSNMVVLAVDIALLITVIAAYEVFMSYVFICEFALIYAYFASLVNSYIGRVRS